MQFALSAWCAHCSRPLQRHAHSLLDSQYWTRYGPMNEFTRGYSTRRSGKIKRHSQSDQSARAQVKPPPSKPPPPPPSVPVSSRPPVGYKDANTTYPHSTASRFDFQQVRERKLFDSQFVAPAAVTIGKDHAAELTAALSKPETRDPVAVFGMIAGWLLRHQARKLGYQVYPDGFMRVSDMMRYSAFRSYTLEKIALMIEADPKNRFELTQLPDLVDGVVREVWWIRAKNMHSMVGVSPHCKRILHLGKLTHIEYRTRPENWAYILKYGIPEGPDFFIRLHTPFAKNLFTDSLPEHKKVLCITINAEIATKMGVSFFHTNDVDVVAVGARYKHVIPIQACKSAVIMEFSKQTLQ